MGKYKSGVRREEPKSSGPDPIWRGIGCLLIILVPVISFAAASVTLPTFQDWGLVPRELMPPLQTPDILKLAPPIAQVFQAVFGRPGILATLVLTIVYIVVIGGIMSVAYGFVYQLAAPSRYGPMDAPPLRTKAKKYKR